MFAETLEKKTFIRKMSDFTALVDLSPQDATSGYIKGGFFCDWINGLSTQTRVQYTKSDGKAGYLECANIDGKGGQVTCYDRQSGGDEVACCTDGTTIFGTPDSIGDWGPGYYNANYKNRPDQTFAAPQCSISSIQYFKCNGKECEQTDQKTDFQSMAGCAESCPPYCTHMEFEMSAADNCEWLLNWQSMGGCPTDATCPTYADITTSKPNTLNDLCEKMYICDKSTDTCNTCQSSGSTQDEATFQKIFDKQYQSCFEATHNDIYGGNPYKCSDFTFMTKFCTPNTKGAICKLQETTQTTFV